MNEKIYFHIYMFTVHNYISKILNIDLSNCSAVTLLFTMVLAASEIPLSCHGIKLIFTWILFNPNIRHEKSLDNYTQRKVVWDSIPANAQTENFTGTIPSKSEISFFNKIAVSDEHYYFAAWSFEGDERTVSIFQTTYDFEFLNRAMFKI